MQITIDLTTMKPATLAAIAADLTQAVYAQDWTNSDEVNTAQDIMEYLEVTIGLDGDAMLDLLVGAGADRDVAIDIWQSI